MRYLLDANVLLRDERAIFEQWRPLVLDNAVKGPRAHDTRYVAAMKRHGISHILTYNERDFRRYDGITALTPNSEIANQGGSN